MRQFLTTAFLLIFFSIALLAQEIHPFSIHDMLGMDRIGDPQVSPDGKQVVFVLRKTDLEANRGRTDLWLVSTEGSGLRQLTTHSASDLNPRWAPDGRMILFLSSRSGSSQVWRLRVDGGEAEQITDLPLSVGNLVLAPDGQQMAFSLEVFPDCATLECTTEKLEEKEEQTATGILFERLFIRHWDTWKDGRRSHVFVRPISGADVVDVKEWTRTAPQNRLVVRKKLPLPRTVGLSSSLRGMWAERRPGPLISICT